MSDDLWLKLARVIGLLGLGLLILSSIGGVSLATRTAQKMKFFKGQTFKYHRGVSVVGAILFLVHPIPLLLAHHTTGMSWQNIFLPFTAPKQGILIAWGTLAAYTLLIVTVAALALRALARRYWRAIHYGTYLVLFLGLLHSLTISNEFYRSEPFRITEPDKFLLLLGTIVALSLPFWRVIVAHRLRARKAT